MLFCWYACFLCRGQKAKIFDGPAYGPTSLNPYFDRPPTAKRNEDERFARKAAMAELNHEKNIPEGVDNQTWEHLCAYRLEKMEKEWQVGKSFEFLCSTRDNV